MSTEDSIDEKNEEYLNNTQGESSRCYNLLRTDYEICRQENHDLKRRLELNEAMLRTVQEANESLEQSLQRFATEKRKEISVLEEKHRCQAKEYENMILSLEAQLAERDQELTDLRQQAEAQCNKCTPVADDCVTLALEAENITLRNRIDEFVTIVKEKEKESERAEEMIECLKNRCEQFESYSQSMKERLEEKDQVLEETRAELALQRAKAAALENAPTSESRKGNSLFAEVEDRRQSTMYKMNKLRDQYAVLRRVCKTQIAEIKKLRMERTATLRKWEADSNNALENEELIQKYKNRISDLESKLKTEMDKNCDSKQLDSTDTSFEYFQSLLNAKKKEINEFRIKVEDLTTKLLVEEETKRNVIKELRYWKYKASSLEAQLCAEQVELQLNLMDDVENDILKELNNCKDMGSGSPVQSLQNSGSEADNQSMDKAKSNYNDTTNSNTVGFKTSSDLNEERTVDNKETKRSNKTVHFTKNIIAKSESRNENRKN